MILCVTCTYFDGIFTVRLYHYEKTYFRGPLTEENCVKIKDLIATLDCKTVIFFGVLDDPRIGFDARKIISAKD